MNKQLVPPNAVFLLRMSFSFNRGTSYIRKIPSVVL